MTGHTAGRTDEIWVLGGTGRIGRIVADLIAADGVKPVLVGRESDRLRSAGAALGARVVIADGAERMAAEIARQRPPVVINTIGDYAETATMIAGACLPGGHYLDLAADLSAVPRLLALHQEAVRAGSTLITGAGFGVLATESVVARLCRDRPVPVEVRVDALASYATDGGPVGTAFADSIVDVLTTGGRRIRDGRLVPARLGAAPQRLTLPDGERAGSAGAPSAELLAAQRASRAPSVSVTSAMVPTSPIARGLLPVLGALLHLGPVRRFAVRRLAAIKVEPAPRPRRHSWGHAVITWPDGTRREGWLRADDGMDYTAAVAAETALRLARGEAGPGAYTPAAALGADLAVAAGGTFLLDEPARPGTTSPS